MIKSLNLGSIARSGEQCYNGDALRQALLKRGVFTESKICIDRIIECAADAPPAPAFATPIRERFDRKHTQRKEVAS